MTLETFFDKFEMIADAPGAVGKMWELVLDFAISGKLVATECDWPKHSLKSLTTKIGSGATPKGGREAYVREGIPLIRSMNVHFQGFEPTGLVFLSDEQADLLSNVIVQPNDVLLNITGASIGRVTVAPDEMAGARVNQHVTIIRPKDELLPKFLSIFLASPSKQRMIDDIQVGATRQALTKGMIENFEIPLPPLAEQHRIVAKVDELMALVDELEARLAAFRTTAENLLAALVAELTGTNNGRNTSASPAKPAAPVPRPLIQPVPTAPIAPASPTPPPATPAPSAAPKNARTLTELRKAAGLSQSAVAKAMSLNQAYISQMETGKRAITESQRQELAVILGATPDMIRT